MSDLDILFNAQEKTARWNAEKENATARLQLAQIEERCAYLISQRDPLAKLNLHRDHLRLIFSYLQHGNLSRLGKEIEACV